jgi:GntR family transcriptional regulator, rspAB operon transcriptional repressor
MRLAAAPITPLTLVDHVHQRIWDWINSGKLEAGDWLRIQELGRTLKVSDTPIREALIRLQQSGLVETIPHVGTRVKRFTRRDIEEVFDLREALECHALRQAAIRFSREDLERLRHEFRQAETALHTGEAKPALEADMALHTEIVRAADNTRIVALFENLWDQIQLIAMFGNRNPDGPRRFLRIHLRIVNLLLRKEIAAAARLLSEHMRLAKENALIGYFGPPPKSRPTPPGDHPRGGAPGGGPSSGRLAPWGRS